MVELEKSDARLQSEIFINEKRAQDLQNQLIKYKGKSLKKKNNILISSSSSVDNLMDEP